MSTPAWKEAVWCSELKPLERLVAAVYAGHADLLGQSAMTLDSLTQRTGLSRDAANRALRGLVEKGWLVPLNPQPGATITYRLMLPARHGASTSGPARREARR